MNISIVYIFAAIGALIVFGIIGLVLYAIIGVTWDHFRYKYNWFHCREKWEKKYPTKYKDIVSYLFLPSRPW